jgi:transcriptional regulator with XRE-family HTH domain
MIKNNRQYEYTKKNLVFLKKELELMKKKYPMDKDKIKFLSQSRIEHIAQLEKEIKEYEDIKKNPFPGSSKIDELYKINQNLARFRIARGITQKQMARKVGCKQSDISRLEREGYCGYSINQLYKITKALNIKIEIKLIPKEILIEREELEVEEFPDIFRHKLLISTNISGENLWHFRLKEFISPANEDKKISFEEEHEKIFSLA